MFCILLPLNSFAVSDLEVTVPSEELPFKGKARFYFNGTLPDVLRVGLNSIDIKALKTALNQDATNLYVQNALGFVLVKNAYNKVFGTKVIDYKNLISGIKRNKNRRDVLISLNEAKTYLDHVLMKAPERFAQAYYVRGVMYLMQEMIPEALADFYSGMQSDRKNSSAADGAYICYLQMYKNLTPSQKEEWAAQIAGVMSSRLAMATVKKAHDYLILSNLLQKSGNPSHAYMITEKAIELNPEDKTLLTQRTSLEAILNSK